MTTWTHGYVADIDYTHGYYRELTPTLLSFAAALASIPHFVSMKGLRYCELGCGQGVSANIIAAANPTVEVHANDFNPSQIAGARQLAAEGGLTNVHFQELAFAEFAAEPSLPASFDVIALHGIYSWISAENRRHIVDFIRRKLRPGGLLYISYNTLPGWAAVMPLRRLLVDQAATRTGPITPRIEEGLALAESLIKANAGYIAQNPALTARLEKLKGMNRSYLAHEYMNADWTPFYFADVARELGDAKLTFLCSAHILDGIDSIHMTTDQLAILSATADPVRRQGLRDYMVNQQFRRDIFIKGGALAPPALMQARLLDQRLALSLLRSAVPMKLQATLGEVDLQADVYGPILDKLASGPLTIRELLSDSAVAVLGWPRLHQAVTVLVGAGHVQPCLPAQDEAKREKSTKVFNAAVMKRANWSNDLNCLASPVTGGGTAVDRIEQMFLASLAQKEADPASYAWSKLSEQGQSLIKDGRPLTTHGENIDELKLRFSDFTEKRLPILKQLGIT